MMKSQKLDLRNARFRAARITPLAFTHSPNGSSNNDACSSPASQDQSLDEHPSGQENVLQEISNSSMRRQKRHDSQKQNTGPPGTPSEHPSMPPRPNTPPPPSPFDPNYSMVSPRREERVETRKRRKSVHKRSSVSSSRRSVSGDETAKYIQYLESQLATANSQLQQLTSPNAVRSQGAKLRALHSESSDLREQLSEWENKFGERVREQIEDHELIVAGLRSQLEDYRQDADANRQRVKELELRCDDKDQALLVVESAKYDLERRLEMMSELIATSPTRLDLVTDRTIDTRRRSIQPRTKGAHQRLSALLMSPERKPFNHPPFFARETSDEDATSRPSTCGSDLDVSSPIILPQTDSGYSTELLSDRSAHVQSEDEFSPTRRLSWIRAFPPPATGPETRTRPTRRMRRFHSGSTGPRSLILPATTHAGSYPASAPIAPTSAAQMIAGLMCNLPSAAGDIYRTPDTSRSKTCLWFPTRGRATSLDEEQTSGNKQRRHRFLEHHPASSAPSDLGHDEFTVHDDDDDDDMSTRFPSRSSRVVSISSQQAFHLYENLQDELNRIQDSATDRTPSSHFGERSPSPLHELDDSGIGDTTEIPPRYASSTISQHRVESPDLRNRGIRVNLHDSGPVLLLRKISHFLDTYSSSAKILLSNVWSNTALSRPVFEFRWFLIRILLQGIQRRKVAFPRRRFPAIRTSSAIGLGLTIAPGVQVMAKDRFAREVERRDEEEEAMIFDLAYGEESSRARGSEEMQLVAWAKLSMTMLVAVGLAIRDGPSSLLAAEAEESSDVQ